ncbi:uncharacterized protein LOC120412960 [Culex pipiens pallens]|uniref:uncharacterized protein LOC120412960 n=1 Tax=Culex pipiens pallens TaxID=42434 RepID=UPI0022AAF5A4|nr:uncharacterized protein LOC120412960 [Culex pipiens pallens]
MGRKCEVSTCSNNEAKRNGASFIKFPLDPAISQQWVEFCDSEELTHAYRAQGGRALINRKICSVHFAEEDFRNRGRPDRGLRFGTVPRIVGCSFLPSHVAKAETSRFVGEDLRHHGPGQGLQFGTVPRMLVDDEISHFAQEDIRLHGPDQGLQFGTVPRMLVDDNTGTNLDLLPTFVDEEWLESDDEMNDDPTSQVALGHASELNDDLGGPCDQEDKEKWTGNSNNTITPDGEDVFNGNPLGSAEPSVFIHVWLNSEEQLEPGSSYITTLDENIAEYDQPPTPISINGWLEAKTDTCAPEAIGALKSEPSIVLEGADGTSEYPEYSYALDAKWGSSKELIPEAEGGLNSGGVSTAHRAGMRTFGSSEGLSSTSIPEAEGGLNSSCLFTGQTKKC